MTIEEQLASMPPPLVSEWESEIDESGLYRRLVVQCDKHGWEFETWEHFGGTSCCIDDGALGDGNHLAELYRWLVKGDE